MRLANAKHSGVALPARVLVSFVAVCYTPRGDTQRLDRRSPPCSVEVGQQVAMTKKISLGLAIHNHQPVGNFPFVFAQLYDQAYEPMVRMLERHSGVHLA